MSELIAKPANINVSCIYFINHFLIGLLMFEFVPRDSKSLVNEKYF